MKKYGIKKTLLLTLAVLLVAAAVGVKPALAYFSDYQRAKGTAEVDLAWSTTLEETPKDDSKTIRVTNTGDTKVIVRVSVFAGDFVTVEGSGDWIEEDGWWYYDSILPPGATTEELRAVWDTKDAPDYDFEVVVVHESARVVYEDNETLKMPAGWAFVPKLVPDDGE